MISEEIIDIYSKKVIVTLKWENSFANCKSRFWGELNDFFFRYPLTDDCNLNDIVFLNLTMNIYNLIIYNKTKTELFYFILKEHANTYWLQNIFVTIHTKNAIWSLIRLVQNLWQKLGTVMIKERKKILNSLSNCNYHTEWMWKVMTKTNN